MDKYEYKGNFYYIESSAEMKNPQTREWERCLVYISLTDGRRWVRNEEEFDKLFKLVE